MRRNTGSAVAKRATAVAVLSCVAASTLFTNSIAHAAYTASRLVSGLNQPVLVTQAPGDANGLYIVQRAGSGGTVGDIVRYDYSTHVTSPFFNVSGSLVQDGGLLSLAFHPDYATNGLFYTTSLVGNVDRLEEYKTPAGGGTPTLQRTLLTYTNPATQHTIDWVGFKPGASGAERNYLYVTAGDGGIQADGSNGTFTNRGQDLTTTMGKILRLDVTPGAADAYPADANKNFAIPVSNPFVSDTTGKLKEIFASGLRNPWKASFDRGTGDLYLGDVGFNTKEEIDFLKNDANFNGGADFGWAKREGSIPNPVTAFAGAQGTSLNPIFEVNHGTFSSVTGGYVYRGPIADLQGKYIFGDFNSGKVYALNFDRNTDPTTFNGSTAGVTGVTDITTLINSLIAANGGGGPITGLVSFGEDAHANLYLVSIGTGNIFNPALGTGSVFALNPLPESSIYTWAADANGGLPLATNWQYENAPPSVAGPTALFGNAITASRTITLTAGQTLGSVKFDSAFAYTLSGTGTLTLDRASLSPTIQVVQGNHTIDAPVVFNKSGTLDVANGTSLTLSNTLTTAGVGLIKIGNGSATTRGLHATSLAVNGGKLSLVAPTPADGTSVVGTLDVSTGATLNLNDNALIVDYASTSPLVALTAAVKDGRITADALAAQPSIYTIGILDTAAVSGITSFGGASVDGTSILATLTFKGDGNLDHKVDFGDLLTLAKNYAQAGRTMAQGDVNLDGSVDFTDLLALAKNYGMGATAPATADLSQLDARFAADWTLAQALAPEPATLAAAISITVLGVRRSRRR